MSVPQNEYQYFLPAEEKEALRELSIEPWRKLYFQAGKIEKHGWLVEPHVYTIGGFMIGAKTRSLLLLTSKDLVDRTEIFRVTIVTDPERLADMLKFTRPPLAELVEFPNDLKIDQFLGVRNQISLLRFKEEIEDGENADITHVVTESGLLVSNSNARMIFYPDIDVPLDFRITTDNKKIDEVLGAASIIEM
jgi:hypothetical protein